MIGLRFSVLRPERRGGYLPAGAGGVKRTLLTLAVLVCTWFPSAAAAAITTTTCTTTVQTGCVVVPLAQYASARAVAIQVSGTWSGTLQFEVSNESGASAVWVPALALPSGGGSSITSTTENGGWHAVTGFSYFRVRASSLASGSANVTVQPTGAQPPVELVRTVGPTFGPVGISGSVNATLTSESIAALGPAPCAQGETKRLALTATPTPVPADLSDGGVGALSGRTDILLVNSDTVQRISCRPDPGDGGLPDCATPGFGLTLFPNGGHANFTARDNVRIRCRTCTGTGSIEYQEESCAR